MKIPISAVILTYNEEKNIEKCLKSVFDWAEEIWVIDSYSTDKTLEIAKRYTDKICQHKFENHIEQWEWALKNLPIKNEWILGLDADHTVSEELKQELTEIFKSSVIDADGFYVKRKQFFLGRWIRFGGYYPKYLLKIFKKDKVIFDKNELVDHHFYIKTKTRKLKGSITEDNINERDLSFWLQKHIRYAELQAKEYINKAHNQSAIPPKFFGQPDARTLFIKNIYIKIPLFMRALFYFVYRYFFCFGFLDGREGLIFHFLQGFWYRFMIDAFICQYKKTINNL